MIPRFVTVGHLFAFLCIQSWHLLREDKRCLAHQRVFFLGGGEGGREVIF